MSYQIRITSIHVPEALAGVPLPVEIVGANGAVQRAVLILQEGATRPVDVKAPGDYVVRAELPSGRWLADAASAAADAAGAAAAGHPFGQSAAVLDFNAAETPLDDILQPALAAQTAAKSLPPRVSAAAPPNAGASVGLEAMAAPAPPAQLDFGLFSGWVGVSGSGAAPARRAAAIKWRAPSTELALPGNLRLPEGLGWSGDSTQWRPALVRVTNLGDAALVVTPPAYAASSLTLLPDPETGLDPLAPPLLAVWESGHKTADALFAYVQRGALVLAREAAPALVEQAESLLVDKGANPIHATIAAYTLLTIGDTTHGSWMANLAGLFPFLPDGAIIYGWHLIHAGQAEQAAAQFHAALARGLPIYSAGVRLLRDGLNFVAGMHRDDAQLRADADLAYQIAAAANLDSELTCLRLGAGGLSITA
jgi:hypothetical protein